jgi:DNA-binding winged helix-turn-helix (wHTH) protein
MKFGEDFELDLRAYELRRSGLALKLEPTPFGILALLIEQRGELVTRQQIVEKIWGKGVFLDTDNSINGAIRKIRQVLNDDSENPRFIQTVTGRGYRPADRRAGGRAKNRRARKRVGNENPTHSRTQPFDYDGCRVDVLACSAIPTPSQRDTADPLDSCPATRQLVWRSRSRLLSRRDDR